MRMTSTTISTWPITARTANATTAITAAGVLLDYVQETPRTALPHLRGIRLESADQRVGLVAVENHIADVVAEPGRVTVVVVRHHEHDVDLAAGVAVLEHRNALRRQIHAEDVAGVLRLAGLAAAGPAIRALLGLAPTTARRVEGDGSEHDVPLGVNRTWVKTEPMALK